MSNVNWHEIFEYDETSVTCLRWKIKIVSGRNGNQVNVEVGDTAGTIPVEKKYHSTVSYNSEQYLVHRIVWEMFKGELTPDWVIDHEDGDGRNNRIGNLRKVDHPTNMRNCKMRIDNKTGVCGVFKFLSRHGSDYFSAIWKDLTGKQKSKSFSSTKYGYAEAFRLACVHRAKMIEELNEQGAGYSKRHGT